MKKLKMSHEQNAIQLTKLEIKFGVILFILIYRS